MKGDVITRVTNFIEEVKNNPTAQQILLNMTIQKVFEKTDYYVILLQSPYASPLIRL